MPFWPAGSRPSAMIEILDRRHIVAARALGLSEPRILFGHALPNAMGPALTVIGLSFAYALTGAVLVEIIFAWPGLGRYVSEAILAKDFPVIAAVVCCRRKAAPCGSTARIGSR
ncbi:ABC transporter permease subunit [Shinella sp.]|uniref:ABC transporter permease subunit n=1 Tax=Shinella sp. TaxID=1870904 RepID=UPI0039B8DB13